MFRFILCCIGLLTAVSLSNPDEVLGQKLHLIIAANSEAGGGISSSVQKDGENIRELFTDNVPADKLDIIEAAKDQFTEDGLLGCIRKVKSRPEDVIVFYYSGHGAYDENTREQFLDMGAGKGKQLYRVKILEEIKKKTPRLTVLLTDCCNIKSKFTGEDNSPAEAVETLGIKKLSPLFEKLFFNEGILGTGVVDMTSSVKGEFSFCFRNQAGSLFTDVLVSLFRENKDNAKAEWKTMAADLTAGVKQKFTEDSEFYTKEAKFAFDSLGLRHLQQTTQTVAVLALPGVVIEDKPIDQPIVKPPVRFGVRAVVNPGKEGGMKITEVIKGTPAEQEGVETGDIFLSINGKSVDSEEEYSQAVDDSPQMMDILLINVKDNRKYKATIKLGW
ncbi:MAG: PDZ domain-containing protein [Planctomycetaceae bacterium]|jgi:hypothetical protein|nr:PDZ domain-containing protein [Planctomycetaceae bacterium]